MRIRRTLCSLWLPTPFSNPTGLLYGRILRCAVLLDHCQHTLRQSHRGNIPITKVLVDLFLPFKHVASTKVLDSSAATMEILRGVYIYVMKERQELILFGASNINIPAVDLRGWRSFDGKTVENL